MTIDTSQFVWDTIDSDNVLVIGIHNIIHIIVSLPGWIVFLLFLVASAIFIIKMFSFVFEFREYCTKESKGK